jgi:hypothetical protein
MVTQQGSEVQSPRDELSCDCELARAQNWIILAPLVASEQTYLPDVARLPEQTLSIGREFATEKHQRRPISAGKNQLRHVSAIFSIFRF